MPKGDPKKDAWSSSAAGHVVFRKLLREVKQPVVIFLTLPVTIAESRRTASFSLIPNFR